MLIEIKDIYKIYNEGKESEVRALDGVSLQIDRGEFVAIVGQSGSGKSTMMNVLGCLDIPTYGTYLLNGTEVTELSDRQLAHIRNKEIGFIFQQYNLIQSLTVLENVELPLIYQGVNADDRRDMALEALARVGMSRQPSTFIMVDLPEPDWPTTATNSPFPMVRETPSRARTSLSRPSP